MQPCIISRMFASTYCSRRHITLSLERILEFKGWDDADRKIHPAHFHLQSWEWLSLLHLRMCCVRIMKHWKMIEEMMTICSCNP